MVAYPDFDFDSIPTFFDSDSEGINFPEWPGDDSSMDLLLANFGDAINTDFVHNPMLQFNSPESDRGLPRLPAPVFSSPLQPVDPVQGVGKTGYGNESSVAVEAKRGFDEFRESNVLPEGSRRVKRKTAKASGKDAADV